MVKIPVVPAGNSPHGKTFQFVQPKHREAYRLLTGREKPTAPKLKALATLGSQIDYGEEHSTSVPQPQNAAQESH